MPVMKNMLQLHSVKMKIAQPSLPWDNQIAGNLTTSLQIINPPNPTDSYTINKWTINF